jgi:hypothetical protein|tara:strand:- start:647 stop:883 length:237 start_codon:yes stop_codon:yes gene_type:complete
MSLFKTYTSDSRRIFEATETGGEDLKPSGEPTGPISNEQWKQWRNLLTKQTEEFRKKMIKIKWKNLVALLKKRTMHTK